MDTVNTVFPVLRIIKYGIYGKYGRYYYTPLLEGLPNLYRMSHPEKGLHINR